MGVLQLLAQENYIAYNKIVARKLGVNSAILLGALCTYQNSFNNKEFYKNQSKIIEDTCLSEHEIRQATKKLCESGILIVEKKGLPAQNYYFIAEDKLCNFLMSCCSNFEPLDVQNVDNTIKNTLTKNTVIKNTDILEEKKVAKKKSENFVPPTVEEVRDYCQANGLEHVDAEFFIDHYTANGWVVGKSSIKMKSWQATVRNWERRAKEKLGLKQSGTSLSSSDIFDDWGVTAE